MQALARLATASEPLEADLLTASKALADLHAVAGGLAALSTRIRTVDEMLKRARSDGHPRKNCG